jgi:hypothetical protein
MQNLRKRWENCNLQFSVNYTKYYTLAIFAYKSLIYKDFLGAWLDLLPTSRTKVMEQSPLISENSGYETIQIYR